MIRRNKPDPKISFLEATMQKLYTSGKLLQYDGGHKGSEEILILRMGRKPAE